MTRRFILALLAAASTTAPLWAQPTSTNTITLQAKLDGVNTPTANLTVKFFDALTGGNQVGPAITLSNQPVTGGVVSVPVSPVDASIFNGQTRYMEIAANSTTLSPRTLVTSVPYAMTATAVTSSSTISALRANLSAQSLDDGQANLLNLTSNFHHSPHGPAAYFEINDWDIKGTWGACVNYKNADNDYDLFRGWSGDIRQPTFRVTHYGMTITKTLQITGGSDIAEPADVSPTTLVDQVIPGMVMTIDREHDGKLVPCSSAYDGAVAGVISGANGLQPGLVLKAQGVEHADGQFPLAMTGRVWVWCDATETPVHRGDALTTSATPGHAVAATDASRKGGAVIGKAMTELREGKGLVLVLVNLQ